jgi:hypothetical protein
MAGLWSRDGIRTGLEVNGVNFSLLNFDRLGLSRAGLGRPGKTSLGASRFIGVSRATRRFTDVRYGTKAEPGTARLLSWVKSAWRT